MTQWEPIDGKEIQVGDIVSDVNLDHVEKFNYLVTGFEHRKNVKGLYIQFTGGIQSYWYPQNTFKYVKFQGTQYDPKQQPWDESDI